ncbi:hypothetical protein CB1_000159019 [Camelus ferus]|nr:hypothetical protein CB1_000159019 [Camelus ferus]
MTHDGEGGEGSCRAPVGPHGPGALQTPDRDPRGQDHTGWQGRGSAVIHAASKTGEPAVGERREVCPRPLLLHAGVPRAGQPKCTAVVMVTAEFTPATLTGPVQSCSQLRPDQQALREAEGPGPRRPRRDAAFALKPLPGTVSLAGLCERENAWLGGKNAKLPNWVKCFALHFRRTVTSSSNVIMRFHWAPVTKEELLRGPRRKRLLDTSCRSGRRVLNPPGLGKDGGFGGMSLNLPEAIQEGSGEEVTFRLFTRAAVPACCLCQLYHARCHHQCRPPAHTCPQSSVQALTLHSFFQSKKKPFSPWHLLAMDGSGTKEV